MLVGARILIVEDEYFIADDLARALKRERAEVLGPVATIDEAEALLAAQPVDGAIVDLDLRGAKAFSLIEHLAARKLSCVIVSGYDREEFARECWALPRLAKPVDASRVIDLLVQGLGRAVPLLN